MDTCAHLSALERLSPSGLPSLHPRSLYQQSPFRLNLGYSISWASPFAEAKCKDRGFCSGRRRSFRGKKCHSLLDHLPAERPWESYFLGYLLLHVRPPQNLMTPKHSHSLGFHGSGGNGVVSLHHTLRSGAHLSWTSKKAC